MSTRIAQNGNLSTILFMVLFLMASGGLFFLLNPLNLFVEKSPGFSEDIFRRIDIGMTEEEVVSILGEPLEIRHEDYHTSYVYMGNQPGWLISYRKAWILLDHQNRVMQVSLLQEP